MSNPKLLVAIHACLINAIFSPYVAKAQPAVERPQLKPLAPYVGIWEVECKLDDLVNGNNMTGNGKISINWALGGLYQEWFQEISLLDQKQQEKKIAHIGLISYDPKVESYILLRQSTTGSRQVSSTKQNDLSEKLTFKSLPGKINVSNTETEILVPKNDKFEFVMTTFNDQRKATARISCTMKKTNSALPSIKEFVKQANDVSPKTICRMPELDKEGAYTRQYSLDGRLVSLHHSRDGKNQEKSYSFWPNGGLFETREWKDDLGHGMAISYYETGIKFEEIEFKKGKVNGKQVLYFPSGKKYAEAEYRNNKRNGLSKFYNSAGTLLGIEVYEDGDLVKSNVLVASTPADTRESEAMLEYIKKNLNLKIIWD